mmetsp:Transcript_3439/g.9504  ORF Transcript_3439/g.9504 Transcript_3439/m.9504 type:complete len:90 (-) Transcript_3439:214-483(-)
MEGSGRSGIDGIYQGEGFLRKMAAGTFEEWMEATTTTSTASLTHQDNGTKDEPAGWFISECRRDKAVVVCYVAPNTDGFPPPRLGGTAR